MAERTKLDKRSKGEGGRKEGEERGRKGEGWEAAVRIGGRKGDGGGWSREDLRGMRR